MEQNEMIRNTLTEKLTHLTLLVRRLAAPHPVRFGPRGQSQERALIQISLREGITQRELMERLGVQPSTMSELIDKLEASHLVERRPNTEDKRSINLFLSEEGRLYLEKRNDTDLKEDPFGILSEEEKNEFARLTDKVIAAAEDICIRQSLPLHPFRFRGGCPPRAQREGEPENVPPFRSRPGIDPAPGFRHRPPRPCEPRFGRGPIPLVSEKAPERPVDPEKF